MLYFTMIIGMLMFSGSLYFLRDYIECIREKNKDPKISNELLIFLFLIIGFLVFSYSCYLIGGSN